MVKLCVLADMLTWCQQMLVRPEALALSLSNGLLQGSMQLPHVPIFSRHIHVTALLESDLATRSDDISLKSLAVV